LQNPFFTRRHLNFQIEWIVIDCFFGFRPRNPVFGYMLQISLVPIECHEALL